MTQEEKQLLFKDICSRLPYGVMCHTNKINLDGELLFINKVYDIVALYNDKAAGKFDTCQIADVKPYLRSMSSMTEVERLVYEQRLHDVGRSIDVIDADDVVSHIDWLLSRHLDFRGLIPMGLALEAPEGMYKTE